MLPPPEPFVNAILGILTIRQMNIEGVDLNLLGPLAALLEERHVSRAAERQHMSQPAMSRALRELRIVFDDELLVRTAGAYQLTPRAERLQRELAETLPRLQSLFSIEPFDPLNAGHTFRLASSDFLLSVIAPPLLRQALAQSPGSTFRFDGYSDTVYLDAERGALDIVFTATGAAPPPLRSEPLFEDSYSCLLSAEHPLARAAEPTLDAYLDCDHVIINIAEARQGTVDIRLGALGRPRRANVTVPYHALAAAVVQQTSLVATLPNRLLDALTIPTSLSVIPTPAEIAPISFSMAWHPRLDNDPAQRWLRETIRSATSSDQTSPDPSGKPLPAP
jgi:DNA-binding transcriptional LysR family regulator